MKLILFNIFLLTSNVNGFLNKNLNPIKTFKKKELKLRKNLVNPINGLELGIPLNIIENVFTNIHYGYDITTSKMVGLQFLIGYYTYGKDRYKDALEYNENNFQTNKNELYEYLVKYKNIYNLSYCLTFYTISYILLDDNIITNFPFILLLYSSEYYKDIKKTNALSKSIYVSIMWSLTTVILPCVLNDHNYYILMNPEDYLPCTFSLFGMTNLADLKDIDEDKINNVKTIPTEYGKDFTNLLVLISLSMSSLIFGLNDNYYKRPIINTLFILQNTVVSGIPLIMGNHTNNI